MLFGSPCVDIALHVHVFVDGAPNDEEFFLKATIVAVGELEVDDCPGDDQESLKQQGENHESSRDFYLHQMDALDGRWLF